MPLQGHDMGHLDPEAPPFLEYLGDFVRYLDLTLDAWDGSGGGTEILCGIQKVTRSVQLEISRREFLRGQLSQYQSPLGRSGRHRAFRQRPPRYAGTAVGAQAAHRVPGARPSNRASQLTDIAGCTR